VPALLSGCVFIASSVVIAVVALRAPEAAPVPVLLGTTASREAYWEERVKDVGPIMAYREFSDAVAPLSPALRHENAHAFGGALFSASGLAGLVACDAQFSYGCYHEFLGRAIATLGIDVVNELNTACVENLKTSPLSCQHGIGHGIEAYYGYDLGALKKGLALCKSLPFSDPIGGCYGGIFMEYNMQTMLGEQGRTRPVHAGDPHYPCNELEALYQPACAFWSPQWWRSALGADSAHIGALCDEVGSESLVRNCYEGLGTVAPPEADFDPQKTAALCGASSKSALHQLYCKSYAANAITVGGAGQSGDGTKVCDGLAGDYLDYCIAYAKNQANIAQQLPPLM
jgi:hypothetical protein